MIFGDLTFLDVVSIVVDVAIVYYLVYRGLLIIRGTRAVPMLMGLLGITLLYFASQELLGLSTFNWLLDKFFGSLLLIVVVIFQADIRRALTAFGKTQLLSGFRSGAEAQVVDDLVKAAQSLASQRIGALIIVERDGNLGPYMEESIKLEARLSKELLYSIFVPERHNPLHDGAVVIREGRVAAAGVFLPMSVNPHIDRSLGTRHRAALGLAEEVDAVAVVVSEERGTVSLAVDGQMEIDLGGDLRERLTDLLIRRPRAASLFRRDRGVVPLPKRPATEPSLKPVTQTQPPRPAEGEK